MNIPEKIDLKKQTVAGCHDLKKQTVAGCHAIANAFNNFFVSVLNASETFSIDFTHRVLSEVEILIEIAKDALNASSDGFIPDFTPGRLLPNCPSSLYVHFCNLVFSKGIWRLSVFMQANYHCTFSWTWSESRQCTLSPPCVSF